MKKFLVISVLVVVGLPALLVLGFVAVTSVRFARERRSSDAAWAAARPAGLTGIGSVARLRVLPLVEADAVSDDLRRGIGVSYLVRAGDETILFDVAGNPAGETRPPVVTNAAKLGVDLGAVGAIVISHLHRDHVGDLADLLATAPVAERLATVPIYLPEPTQIAGARARVVEAPQVLGRGIASIGPIAKSYWGMGTVIEQALAVNVEGRGIVLIVGCGHQSVERAIRRAEVLFDAPVYGVIGGLHYPVTGFPGVPKAISLLMRFGASGEQPWHGPLGRSDVRRAIALIEARVPGVVGVSPHDSSPWTLDEFRAAFGERYRDVRAGLEIVVGA